MRKALGAPEGALIAMIMRETGWMVLVGVVVGAALSAGGVQLIASRCTGFQLRIPRPSRAQWLGSPPWPRSRRGCPRIVRRAWIR